MLTNEQADQHVKGLGNVELERLADQVGTGEGDQRLLATRAVLEKVRRTEQAEAAARVAAPAIAAKESARYVYEQSGLDPAGFEKWYAERLGQEASTKLDQQRAAMRHIAARRF